MPLSIKPSDYHATSRMIDQQDWFRTKPILEYGMLGAKGLGDLLLLATAGIA
ncbi:MAG: hypothetical protein ACPGLY_25300 [Rubripirellula sp.]